MKKNLTFFLALAFFAFTCGNSSKTTTDTAATNDNTEVKADNKSDATTDAPTETTTSKGDGAFTTTVLKDGIASPQKEMKATIGGTNVSIIYGSPSAKGRTLWGELVPYGKVWRTGANEATSIEFSNDVAINGEKLVAGKYGLYTIPTADNWIIIFNSVNKEWGAYKYEESKDVLRVEATPQTKEESSETMDFVVDGNTVVLRWGNLAVPFEVKS